MAEHKFKIGQMVYFHPDHAGPTRQQIDSTRSHNGCPRQAANINTESEAHMRSTSEQRVKTNCGRCSNRKQKSPAMPRGDAGSRGLL